MAPNLDRHPLHKGQYIAYDARGFAFRVEQYNPGDWRGYPSHAALQTDPRGFHGRTLREVAAAIGASKARD